MWKQPFAVWENWDKPWENMFSGMGICCSDSGVKRRCLVLKESRGISRVSIMLLFYSYPTTRNWSTCATYNGFLFRTLCVTCTRTDGFCLTSKWKNKLMLQLQNKQHKTPAPNTWLQKKKKKPPISLWGLVWQCEMWEVRRICGAAGSWVYALLVEDVWRMPLGFR